jgi:hypothetical protein
MVTSPFFNNFSNSMESELFDSLIVESIKIYGQDMYYIIRTENNYDGIYGEDDVSSYDNALLIEMYIKSVEGFGGQGSFMSKFGLEIRDQVTFSVAKRTFENDITNQFAHIIRPREGDLIYFPLNKKCFEIKYVDVFHMFYPLGSLHLYDAQCELFEYSNEKFNTGIAEIDQLQKNYSFNTYDYGIKTEDGFALKTENGVILTTDEYEETFAEFDPLADNVRIEQESARDTANSLLAWDESNPFAENKY